MINLASVKHSVIRIEELCLLKYQVNEIGPQKYC